MKHSLSVLLLLALSSNGCLTSSDKGVTSPLSAHDDEAYFPVLQQNSKHAEVIKNFETKFTLDTTHLTSSLRQAMAKRYRDIFKDDQSSLSEAAQKTGFFVSLYTANRELQDLKQKTLWNVTLETNGQRLDPIAIERLTPKERWAPFFPSISLWSQDYLLLFDMPPPAGDAARGLVLTISSPDGSVRSEW